MGLFGFNAEKKLARALELVDQGQDYEARRALAELLRNDRKLAAGQRDAVLAADRLVRERMISARVQEAEALERAGEVAAARDRLEIALDLAGDDLDRSTLEERHARLASRRRPSAGGGPSELPDDLLPDRPARESHRTADEPEESEIFGEDPSATIELYLDTLPEAQARLYRAQPETFLRGYVALSQGAPRTALRYFDELAWDPLPETILVLERARALLLAKRSVEAIELLERIPVPDPAVRWAKVEVLRDLERYEDAVSEAADLVNSLPDHTEATDALLSWTLLDAGRPDEAWEHLEPWVSGGTLSEEVLVPAAQAAAATGRAEEAAGLLEGLIQHRLHVSLQTGREPAFPVEAGRKLLQLYLESQKERGIVRTLVLHLLDYDPERAETYRELLLRLS